MTDQEAREPLALPSGAYDDLALIVDAVSYLPALDDETAIAVATELRSVISLLARAGMQKAEARKLIAAVRRLYQFRDTLDETGEGLVSEITRSIDVSATEDWRAKYASRWSAGAGAIAKVLNPAHPLAVLDKSLRLAYTYQNILGAARLITDIRPVFNDSGTTVLRSTVSYVLAVEYSDGRHRRRLDLALDAADVEALKLQCERAQTKAQTIRNALIKTGWPTGVAGEE